MHRTITPLTASVAEGRDREMSSVGAAEGLSLCAVCERGRSGHELSRAVEILGANWELLQAAYHFDPPTKSE